MTEQTQPTDAEILDAVKHLGAAMLSPVEVARAVLAKWGTPAGAGEVVAVVGTDAGGVHLYYEGKYLGPQSAKKTVMLLKDLPLGTQLFTTQQPTQAQAGAVPLTDEQIEEIAKQFITRVGSHWEHDDAIPDNGRIEDFVRAIEHAHGIKGADHG